MFDHSAELPVRPEPPAFADLPAVAEGPTKENRARICAGAVTIAKPRFQGVSGSMHSRMMMSRFGSS